GPISLSLADADPALAVGWVVGTICAIGAAIQAKYHRLGALMLMGGAGLATSITFVWFSAPDLARPQLLVGIVTTVLILLGRRWLPKRDEAARIDIARSRGARLRRLRDVVLAVIFGTGIALIAYAVMSHDAPDS